jgi:hypothetical protein
VCMWCESERVCLARHFLVRLNLKKNLLPRLSWLLSLNEFVPFTAARRFYIYFFSSPPPPLFFFFLSEQC